jgi:hypothetical protein
MGRIVRIGAVAAGALSLVSQGAHADRPAPPPLYGYYNLLIDFSKQTFNGTPTPMKPIAFPVPFTTRCDVNGCVVRMDNSDDHARNPGAPVAYEYQWNNDRWETSGQYPYFCNRNDPGSVVTAQRSDYWMPNPDGSFSGERTLIVGGAGCPGEGPGTHVVPIALTPIDPPRAPAR